MGFDKKVYSREYQKARRRVDPQFRKRQVEITTKSQQKFRLIVLKHYSNGQLACGCCGESHYEFLALDHIHNNGAEERRLLGDQKAIFRRLIRENFPDGYQVLCHNCNVAKKNHGICPHQLVG